MELTKKETFNLLTEEDIEVIRAYKEFDVRYKLLKAEKDEQILNWLNANNLDFYDDEVHGVRITRKKSHMRKTLDSTRLKMERPEVYEEFVKENPVKESLEITLKYD